MLKNINQIQWCSYRKKIYTDEFMAMVISKQEVFKTVVQLRGLGEEVKT